MKKITLKILLTILFCFAIFAMFNYAYAANEVEEASIEVLDKDGNYMTYMPHESGGINGYIDSSLEYTTDCQYSIGLMDGRNYEETFYIEGLGHFERDDRYPQGNAYIAKNIENPELLKSGRFSSIYFKVKDVDKNEYINFKLYLLCFNTNNYLTPKSNLTIDDKVIIKDGVIVNDYFERWENNDFCGYVTYDKVYNELRFWNYEMGKINYENMGKDFGFCQIVEEGERNFVEKRYKVASGVNFKMVVDMVDNEKKFAVEGIEQGIIYDQVKEALGDTYNGLKVYDITYQKMGENIQPDGDVEISIPVDANADFSKLIVYRIEDNGEKTEYQVRKTVENDVTYATFTTDHFSTYVLAEKNIQNNVQNNNQDITNNNSNKDSSNENKILDNEPKTGVTNTVILVTTILAISIIGYVICKKKMYK